MVITKQDEEFIKHVLLPWSGVRTVYLKWSNSKKVYPDIWVKLGRIPVITVTGEWAKQGVHERRKRLVHELIGHLAFGWEHNDFMDKVGFSTYPNKDIVSWRIYKDILRGRIKSPDAYIEKDI